VVWMRDREMAVAGEGGKSGTFWGACDVMEITRACDG
jgi:hypothetical protein